ncbi:MAG TPA: alcohol dehydrogenase catalytic domain-containing protein, partial [Candidatus Hydrogenedentes bacterium]|nr:alcohol dehydrogenase catalytic domain-containing protein [Candidatus Hydrogenedentota bacterium]
MSKLEAYKRADAPLPETYRAWWVYGAGLENVGRDGKPVEKTLRPPQDNEVLVRVDALGLCLSDMKIIAQGSAHPRLRGRDLSTDPTVLGHECACTLVAAGAQWKDKFFPGQRFIVQADIYYKGVNDAFGYMIPGGLGEFSYLDHRALDGDEGCYLLPVQPHVGYSQAALAEPWACVEMSYSVEDRVIPKPGGQMLIVSTNPNAWAGRYPHARFVKHGEDLPEGGGWDDIIIENPTPALLERCAEQLNIGGCVFLIGDPVEDGYVSLDVGAVHYQNKRYYGGISMEDIAARCRRQDLLPGGASLFIGAGGPMGQMHVQRAIEKQNTSSRVVATDLDRGRLNHIERRFGSLARQRGVEFITLCPADFASPEAYDQKVRELGGPGGYDDVCVLVPVPALVRQAIDLAGNHALANLFAGIPTGTRAQVLLSRLCKGVKMVGTSGSRISDLRRILSLVEAGELDTNRSVAAIGGLEAAHDGLRAVKEARFPGKTVIYPQISGLPLMTLEEVAVRFPSVGAKMSAEGSWTVEAEAQLLEEL